MKKLSFNVEKSFCVECSQALRRFIGHIEGVESIDVESGNVVVEYDDSKISRDNLLKITKDSIDKLGYKIG